MAREPKYGKQNQNYIILLKIFYKLHYKEKKKKKKLWQ